jgi:predicted metalloprotease
MKWRGRRMSSNVEDRRGQGGLGGGFPGGLGGGLGGPGGFPRTRIPIGVGGGRGISGGGLILILIVLGILWFAGINPFGSVDQSGLSPGGGSGTALSPETADENSQFVATVLADMEDAWGKMFRDSGLNYREPKLVLFSGQVASACGFASAASGPFYCPSDERLYLDLEFLDELQRRFQAPGDFAAAYVIAHEVGHHVQKQIGTLRAGLDNEQSVRTELQADCFAGVWAHTAQQAGVLEAGDIDEALNAAAQVGDDNIQKKMQGRVVPESFTHGSAEQRSRWFKRGFDTGKPDDCDTFGAASL